MEALFDALYNYLITTPFGELLAEEEEEYKLYNTEAPEEVTSPYAVYQLVTSVPDWTFVERNEDVLIQFNLFSDGDTCEEVSDLAAALCDALEFQDSELVIESAKAFSLTRVASLLSKVDGIWCGNITFRIIYKKGD